MAEARLGRLRYDGRGLPRGRSSLSAPDVGAAQRERLTHAVIGVVAEQGYAATAVADIVAAARVSRVAFYAQFENKEACFLEACLHGLGYLSRTIGEYARAARPQPPEDVLRATIAGLLRFLADEPAFARCFLVDMPLAGAEAARRFHGTVDLLADNTRHWHRRVVAASGAAYEDPGVYRMLAAGVAQECAARVLAGRTSSLPDLEGPALRMHVRALLGRDPATA